MTTIFEDKALLDYALPETILAALDIKNTDIGDRLLGSKLLVPAIERMILPPMMEPEAYEEMPKNLRRFMEIALIGDIDDLRKAARIVAVLTQSHNFEKSADGKLLRLAVEYSGVPEIVKEMRDYGLPYVVTLPPLKEVTEETLDSLTEFALRFMLGLMPEAYLRRFAFMHAPDAFPVPMVLDKEDEDTAIFTGLALAGVILASEGLSDETA